jgi:hypothetical protein
MPAVDGGLLQGCIEFFYSLASYKNLSHASCKMDGLLQQFMALQLENQQLKQQLCAAAAANTAASTTTGSSRKGGQKKRKLRCATASSVMTTITNCQPIAGAAIAPAAAAAASSDSDSDSDSDCSSKHRRRRRPRTLKQLAAKSPAIARQALATRVVAYKFQHGRKKRQFSIGGKGSSKRAVASTRRAIGQLARHYARSTRKFNADLKRKWN